MLRLVETQLDDRMRSLGVFLKQFGVSHGEQLLLRLVFSSGVVR